MNGGQAMDSHRAGSGATATSGMSDSSNAQMSNSVIQTNSHNVVVTSQPGGPTGIRGTGMTFNRKNNATGSAVVAQHPSSVSHLIKADAPKTIGQSAQHQGLSPRGSTTSSPGGARAHAPQMLVPRLTHGSQLGQPNIQNIHLPPGPGMVLVRSESGQLLMIHQQVLAQMQAQAQAQGSMASRPATPTNLPPAQVPGSPIISRQVVPSNIVRHASSGATTISPTIAHHRHPVLQSSDGAALPGMTPGTIPQQASTATSATVSNETMEYVKMCRKFLSTLIKLVSNGTQSVETEANVKELVKDLLEGRLEAEEFTGRLYKELNSSRLPSLVPFLKRSLPALRQFTSNATSFIQQSQFTQPAPAPPASTSSPTPSMVTLSSPGPRFATQMTRAQIQPGLSKPGQTAQMVIQVQQQGAMLRPRVTLDAPSMASLRNQAPSRILLGPQQVQMKPLHSVRPVATTAFRSLPPAALSPALKNKLKDTGGTFKDDDDINDVASMAGVNLSEESAHILATNSELVGAVTRSCKDELFLHTSMLQRMMLEIGRRFGVTELGGDVVTYVSHAAQQRLQNLVETVSQVAQQKNFTFKEEGCYEQSGDVRAQLRFFEQLDQLEKQRKEEQEREILLKAAKSRARQEDPEQLRLKQKAKEMQQQELAQMRQREANLTALAAIGPRKKRRLLDSPSSAAAAAAEGVGSSPTLSGGAGSLGSRPTRQRITRINLRDLLFCLENERFSRRSHFLYKGFLK